MKIKLTLIIAALFIVSIYTRCFDLTYPSAVVFDESYYRSICRLYSTQKFHFDKQPPLFKLLLHSVLPRNVLHTELSNKVNQTALDDVFFLTRIIPAMFSVLLVVVVYRLVLLLKYTHFAAVICTFLITLDNGLIVQSRLMVADSFHHVLILLSLYAAVKQNYLITLSHFCFGLAISTNWSSFSLFPVLFLLTILISWNVCTNASVSLMVSLIHGCLYLVSFVLVPVIIYFFVTLLHILLLPNSGPHDTLMSSAFQASLSGGLKSNSNIVTYGSQILLRATGDLPPYGTCYLKSIASLYPVTYGDGRGSSAQQVVSCCHSANQDSQFKIIHPVDSSENLQPVLNDDVIILQHVLSGRLLNTHDVAAPLSKHKQEISCYVDHNASFPTKFEWKVKIFNGNKNLWFNFYSFVLIQHVDTEAYLSVSGIPLPSWGKGCNEVVGEIPIRWGSEPTPWNAEVISTMREKLGTLHNKYFSIWDKTFEYIQKVLFFKEKSRVNHRFASEWYKWPLATTSVAYWHDAKAESQIHFTGNVVSWIGGLALSVLLFCYYLVALTCNQMHVHFLSKAKIRQLELMLIAFGLSWICHLSYFIFTDQSPLFAYQYLPCVIFIHILQACAIEEFYNNCNFLACVCTFIYLLSVIFCYNHLRPLTYGFSNTTKAQLEKIRYWQTWDVIL